MHEWIKLHRDILKHPVMRDVNASHVFIYLLLTSDDNGRGIVSRFETSRKLGLNSNTFYKALQRCAKKYDLVTLMRNSKYTQFHINNWDKYQSIGNTSNTNTVPTRYQHGNTYINKERIDKTRKGFNFSKKTQTHETPQLPINSSPEGLLSLRAVLEERRLIS